MNVIINAYGNLEYYDITQTFRKLIDEAMYRLAAESAYEKQIIHAYQQIQIICVEFTGNGFYVSFSSEIPSDPVFWKMFPFGNTHGMIEECHVGYLLFFRDGKISTLECFCYSDTGEYPFPKMENIQSYSFSDSV